MSIIGTKVITNVGQHDQCLDANGKGEIVGNKNGATPLPTQKWVITEPKTGAFLIFNEHHKKYLGYEGSDPERMEPVLSTTQRFWGIVEVHDHYKLQVYNVGVVCSLDSSAPDAPVTIKNFLGQNEEWILEAYADPTPPPPTGVRGIISVAFKDRALEGTMKGTLLHDHSASGCSQAWTISAESGGHTVRSSSWGGEQYLAVVNNALALSNDKFLWAITGVNGNYKIGYSHPQESCLSLPKGDNNTPIEFSAYKDAHQEWVFKEFPLRAAAQGAITERCPPRQD